VSGAPAPALLRAERLRAGYGSVEVLHELSLELRDGSLCASRRTAPGDDALMTLAGGLPCAPQGLFAAPTSPLGRTIACGAVWCSSRKVAECWPA